MNSKEKQFKRRWALIAVFVLSFVFQTVYSLLGFSTVMDKLDSKTVQVHKTENKKTDSSSNFTIEEEETEDDDKTQDELFHFTLQVVSLFSSFVEAPLTSDYQNCSALIPTRGIFISIRNIRI